MIHNNILGKVTVFDEEGAHKLADNNNPLTHWNIISKYTTKELIERKESFYPYIFNRLSQGEAENLMICRLDKALFVDVLPADKKAAAYLLFPDKLNKALYDNIMEYKDELASYDELTVVAIKEHEDVLEDFSGDTNIFEEHIIGEDDTPNIEKLKMLENHLNKTFRI